MIVATLIQDGERAVDEWVVGDDGTVTGPKYPIELHPSDMIRAEMMARDLKIKSKHRPVLYPEDGTFYLIALFVETERSSRLNLRFSERKAEEYDDLPPEAAVMEPPDTIAEQQQVAPPAQTPELQHPEPAETPPQPLRQSKPAEQPPAATMPAAPLPEKELAQDVPPTKITPRTESVPKGAFESESEPRSIDDIKAIIRKAAKNMIATMPDEAKRLGIKSWDEMPPGMKAGMKALASAAIQTQTMWAKGTLGMLQDFGIPEPVAKTIAAALLVADKFIPLPVVNASAMAIGSLAGIGVPYNIARRFIEGARKTLGWKALVDEAAKFRAATEKRRNTPGYSMKYNEQTGSVEMSQEDIDNMKRVSVEAMRSGKPELFAAIFSLVIHEAGGNIDLALKMTDLAMKQETKTDEPLRKTKAT